MNYRETDPEFMERFEHFAFEEVPNEEGQQLPAPTRWLAVLATLTGCQGIDAFREILPRALEDGLAPEAVKEMIYQSALRSRGAYADTAAAVSKMGLLAPDAFASNEETIAFVEQLNKQFKIAGTSQEGQAAAMLQLTQAMGAGVLRGWVPARRDGHREQVL